MNIDSGLVLGVIVLVGILILLVYWRGRQVKSLRDKLEQVLSQKKSGEVLHGKSWEEFAPFMKHYPFDPGNFKFMGMPIDGISFEDDAIYFVEIKTGKSQLSQKQKKIRDQVERGQIKWLEFRG
ncbi:MAG: Holliday junction resolvase-like protein [Candidatus Gracilibacteria bacterium]|nr:Holliday junction resolvase-like protein [Candidatus Gracilibacteria bacterium]